MQNSLFSVENIPYAHFRKTANKYNTRELIVLQLFAMLLRLQTAGA